MTRPRLRHVDPQEQAVSGVTPDTATRSATHFICPTELRTTDSPDDWRVWIPRHDDENIRELGWSFYWTVVRRLLTLNLRRGRNGA